MPKEGLQYIWLLVILFGSIFITGNNYDPQVFQRKVKYAIKEKKIEILGKIQTEKKSDEES